MAPGPVPVPPRAVPRQPGPFPGPAGRAAVAPGGWRRELHSVLRAEWILALAAYVGLVYQCSAPYTAGAVAGVAVLLGAYGWTRRRTPPRPEPADRLPTALVAVAALALAAVIPTAMLGAMSGARVAAVLAVTCATAAALAVARQDTPQGMSRRSSAAHLDRQDAP